MIECSTDNNYSVTLTQLISVDHNRKSHSGNRPSLESEK